ncbi:PhzF family phenazine biosynthesis protein [Pelagerythrobacter aerophilus]|uniref:PhzF family phenazine biosynthesis protein n=1 Tax=Pelagerythrobacter aerophilus TaxID=2306995 RepID=A0A418NFJ3_9SPHN|nr:PhzF family phenazine biosynthesis protein [Pelagerythrobacter aerophilus]RIV76054.1 PhzF family phenazine biosynthesis protein [Pelagerythrobacter aerophilus]RIV80691.1 PhzF family phenazine biosynthesis protein [Pelagerythrobacter aerophilus]
MKLPYWHVDAFADRPFAGNQAAVMPLGEWLPDDVLQAIGEENNFAETAFVVPDETGAADWELRWFTPACEIRLCGHATLASGHVLLGRDGGERVTFRTRKAGVLEVRRSEAGYELALPAIPTERSDRPEAVTLLGAQPLEIWRNPDRYGIYLFGSEDEVRALAPDLRGLGALGDDQFICTAPGRDVDVVSRVFVPGGGVDEDSVTGSAHAALTPFWAARLGRESFTAHQASRRGGDLTCRFEGDRAWLGGPCVTVVEGTFYLPE